MKRKHMDFSIDRARSITQKKSALVPNVKCNLSENPPSSPSCTTHSVSPLPRTVSATEHPPGHRGLQGCISEGIKLSFQPPRQ